LWFFFIFLSRRNLPHDPKALPLADTAALAAQSVGVTFDDFKGVMLTAIDDQQKGTLGPVFFYYNYKKNPAFLF
jgi:hypothetical protein